MCVQGDLYDHESLVKAIKQVDVVISTVGHLVLADQTKIIAAIKEAGNVKVGWCLPLNSNCNYSNSHICVALISQDSESVHLHSI